MLTGAHLKAEILASGVRLTGAFLDRYGPPFLNKRRAYGNSDQLDYGGRTLPQEFYLLPEEIVVAANLRSRSEWALDWDNHFILSGPHDVTRRVSFPHRPAFYDHTLADGSRLSRLVTLYGGGSLGIFVYGQCALVDMGKACHYCSIEPNHSVGVDFENIIRPDQVEAAVGSALSDRDAPISQVMLNGGNFRDLDRSFLYYVDIVRAARRAIMASGRDVELHLIVFPPRDLELFRELEGTGVSIAINSEVFSPDLFSKYCPGKAETAGQNHIHAALRRAAEILGPGSVYSIIVGGLEDADTMVAPMRLLGDLGVTPVINVFHPDPATPLANRAPPSREGIVRMGYHLQDVYRAHSFMRPFYMNCGRNSIDTEAWLQMF